MTSWSPYVQGAESIAKYSSWHNGPAVWAPILGHPARDGKHPVLALADHGGQKPRRPIQTANFLRRGEIGKNQRRQNGRSVIFGDPPTKSHPPRNRELCWFKMLAV